MREREAAEKKIVDATGKPIERPSFKNTFRRLFSGTKLRVGAVATFIAATAVLLASVQSIWDCWFTPSAAISIDDVDVDDLSQSPVIHVSVRNYGTQTAFLTDGKLRILRNYYLPGRILGNWQPSTARYDVELNLGRTTPYDVDIRQLSHEVKPDATDKFSISVDANPIGQIGWPIACQFQVVLTYNGDHVVSTEPITMATIGQWRLDSLRLPFDELDDEGSHSEIIEVVRANSEFECKEILAVLNAITGERTPGLSIAQQQLQDMLTQLHADK
jgi:hypothetical protein